MTERFTELLARTVPGFASCRFQAAGAAKRVVADGGDSFATAPHGGELFAVAVPVEMRELLYAQILEMRNLIRDMRPERKYVRFEGWELDLLERRLVAPGGGVERLQRLAYALLCTFIRHPRQLLNRAELELSARREGRTYSLVRTIDTCVSSPRRRLSHGGGASLISTARKMGYSLDVNVVRN